MEKQFSDERGNSKVIIEGSDAPLNIDPSMNYVLSNAPKNYKVSELIQFTVKDTGKVQRVIMYDQPVKDYVVTGDINNYYFIVMLICLIVIYCLRKKRSNNFIN